MLARRALMAASALATLDFALNAPDATVIAAYRADEYTAGNWPDRIASEDLTQGTAGNQPAAIADGGADFNNRPVVRFDGSNDRLVTAAFTQAQPLTAIIIAKCTNFSAGSKWVLYGRRADGNNAFGVAWDASENLTMFANSFLGSIGSTHNVAILVEAYASGASSVLRSNSVVGASGNAGTLGITDGISVGAAGNSTGFLGGDVAEIILVSGELTAADRDYLERYCTQRYGFTF